MKDDASIIVEGAHIRVFCVILLGFVIKIPSHLNRKGVGSNNIHILYILINLNYKSVFGNFGDLGKITYILYLLNRKYVNIAIGK